MRAYIIESKEQDISYIPLNSFVYHKGCGFIKRKQTTEVWNDTDFERIYCTNNETLNPTIQKPEDGVLLKDACCLRFVVSGAYDFDKGATITEIIFRDLLGNKIPFGVDNFSDVTLSSPGYWNNETEWGFKNLFNGNVDYTDIASGPTSSTLFNVGMEHYMDESEFHISLTPEQMEVLDTIEIVAGSPEGRVPQSISVFAVFDKDIPETKRETLIFLRTFTAEVDGKRPAYTTKAQQSINPANPCDRLFKNGINKNGNYLIMNPTTGLLESIYCDFPPIFKANGSDEQNEMLCSQDPRSLIVLEDTNGEFSQVSISEYFKNIGWICEFGGCEGLSNTNYAACIKKACEAKERNEATIVRYVDNNFNVIETNITDYLASKNAVCTNLTPSTTTTPTNNIEIVDISQDAYNKAVANGFIGTYENWLHTLYENFLSTLGNINEESFDEWRAAQEEAERAYRATISNLNNLIENTGYGTDGLISVTDPATGTTTTMTASEYKQLILKEDAPVNTISTTLNIQEVYTQSHSGSNITPTEPVTIELDNVVNMDINNIDVIDSLNAIAWHFEEEVIEVPTFDAFGEPIVDKNGFIVKEPKNTIKIVIDEINMPEGVDVGTTEITISDGTTTQTIDLAIRQDSLTIDEFQNVQAPFTKPLKQISEFEFQKKFEWDEAGVAIKYYGSKGVMRVDNISDKFEVTITPDGRSGLIVIKSLFTKDNIQNIHKETVQITDGVDSYDLELYVTSHMRVIEQETFENIYDLGTHIVDNGNFTIPIFNSDGTPKVFNISEYNSYRSTGGGNSCLSYGANLDIIDNQNSTNNNDLFNILVKPLKQRLMGNTFYVIDPYFNYANALANIIDNDDIKVIEITIAFNKFMTCTRSEIKLDKYRFYNSKTDFKHIYRCEEHDFKIYNQAPGLNLEIENPNIVGLAYGENCTNENIYWSCRYGGEAPRKFRLLTGEKYSEIGTTNLKLWDIDSEINISITTIQTLDIILNWNKSERYYNSDNILVGGFLEIDLIHPWNNDWNLVRAWSIDKTKCETIIDIENQKLIINYFTIGETFVYVTDGYITHKIKVSSSFSNQFTPEWTRIDIVDTDFEWYNIKLFNVNGNVTLSGFDNTLIEAELINNSEFRFRKISAEGIFGKNTNITLTDTAPEGTTTANTLIVIRDHNKWLADNLILSEKGNTNDDQITSSVTNNDGSITTTYIDSTIKVEYPDGSIIFTYPDGSTKKIYPNGEVEFNNSVDIPDSGNWTVTNSPDGVLAWIANGTLQIETKLSGTHIIELTHTDGTIKLVNIYVSPIWEMDKSKIIFDNNDYIENGA